MRFFQENLAKKSCTYLSHKSYSTADRLQLFEILLKAVCRIHDLLKL